MAPQDCCVKSSPLSVTGCNGRRLCQPCCIQYPDGTTDCRNLTPCDCITGNFPEDIPADSVGIPRNGYMCADYGTVDNNFVHCFSGVGACCFDEGVRYAGSPQACFNLLEFGIDSCSERGGVFLGQGTTCNNTIYAGNPCYNYNLFEPGGIFQHNKLSACCLPDGGCVPRTYGACLTIGQSIEGVPIYPDPNAFPDVYYCSQQERPNCAEAVELTVACCINGECSDLTEFQCCSMGGEALGMNTTCAESGQFCEPQSGACRETVDDVLPENRRTWTVDLCHPMILVPYIREPHEYPTNDPDFEPGFVEFKSVNLTRAVDITRADLGMFEEPCAHHMGRLVVNGGFAQVAFCSSPHDVSGAPLPQVTLANAAVQRHLPPEDKPEIRNPRDIGRLHFVDEYINDYIEQGSWYFVGAYHAPFVSEVQYHSEMVRCGGRPI